VTLVEDTDLGRATAQELRRTSTVRPILQKPRFDKTVRLATQSVRFEQGRVYLPVEAPWKAAYLAELLTFPQASTTTRWIARPRYCSG
jgi:phage terminase large subunit-like protein